MESITLIRRSDYVSCKRETKNSALRSHLFDLQDTLFLDRLSFYSFRVI